MRRTAVIATAKKTHPLVTARALQSWVDYPHRVEVYYALPEGVYPFGHCVGFWRLGAELWAEIEILENRAHLWPEPAPPELHCESVVGAQGSMVSLLCVIVSTMEVGRATALLAAADQRIQQARRSSN